MAVTVDLEALANFGRSGGREVLEIAEAFGVVVRTVQRDWAKARMRLRRALAT
jgi:DNA-directed RNA polymerase specialized sigma24 family protein